MALTKDENISASRNITKMSKNSKTAEKIGKLLKADKKLDKETKAVETRFNKLNQDNRIKTYLKRKVSVKEFRHEELRMSGMAFVLKGSSFVSLFGARLQGMKGWKRVSIVRNVTINTGKVY